MKNQILEKTCFITLKVQPSAGKVTFCRTKKVASAVYVHTYCQLFTSKLCGRIFDNLQIVILQVANLKTANLLYNYTALRVGPNSSECGVLEHCVPKILASHRTYIHYTALRLKSDHTHRKRTSICIVTSSMRDRQE